MARQRGLEPLAEILQRQVNPGVGRAEVLRPYICPERDVPDGEAALRGACDILAEDWADDREVRSQVHEAMRHGMLCSRVRKEWAGKPGKFEAYYDRREPCAKVPSHRYLAIRRGEAEEVLRVGIEIDEEAVIRRLTGRLVTNPSFLFHRELAETVADCCRRLLFPSLEAALLAEMKETADDEAIRVFSQNLRELLLAPPAGPQVVMGIDPGFRTGCKVAVVDATGKLLEHTTIYPTAPHNRTAEAAQVLLEAIDRCGVALIAVGTGTASRETGAFVAAMLQQNARRVAKVSVNESGASIYSASDVARAEFPDLDLTVRGAVSIARRLQDPLAELVKIDPKSIGVGQYQHDVNQAKLRKALDRDVESCVNLVGVDLNTASVQLLGYVSGVGPKMAEAIFQHRNAHGAFASREALLARAAPGRQGLPAERRLPPRVAAVRSRWTTRLSTRKATTWWRRWPAAWEWLPGDRGQPGVGPATRLRNSSWTSGPGLPTIQDLLRELEKPGRDPRREFRVPRFAEGLHDIADLEPGMVLEGVVTNVTRFGAFVDVGVHQDGLIHVSELDRRFVHDPLEVIAVGDMVRVKVLEIDPERKRIALSRKQAAG